MAYGVTVWVFKTQTLERLSSQVSAEGLRGSRGTRRSFIPDWEALYSMKRCDHTPAQQREASTTSIPGWLPPWPAIVMARAVWWNSSILRLAFKLEAWQRLVLPSWQPQPYCYPGCKLDSELPCVHQPSWLGSEVCCGSCAYICRNMHYPHIVIYMQRVHIYACICI